jgi:hypothetical protein
MTIQRYYIDERGVAKSDTGEWMRADEVNAVLQPRCDRCGWWDFMLGLNSGVCCMVWDRTIRRAVMHEPEGYLHTPADFGCVNFKEKV